MGGDWRGLRRKVPPVKPDKRKEGEQKDDTRTEPVMFQLRKRMHRLVGCADITCRSCVEDLRQIKETQLKINLDDSIPWKIKLCVSRQLLSLGALELFENIWNQYFSKQFLSDENSVYYELLLSSGAIVQNIADGKREASQGILDLNLHLNIVRYLSSDYLDFDNYDSGDPQRERLSGICYGLMGIIYNVVQEISEAREMLREIGIVSVLRRYLENTDYPQISQIALIIQAWVMNNKESKQLISDGDVFDFLVQALQSSIDVGYGRCNGFRHIELLKAVNKLIVNDENKVASVNAGILPIYIHILNSPETKLMDEKLAAIEGLWTLSDHCADDIKQETNCKEVLEKILSTNPDAGGSKKDDDLKRIAREILKQLGLLQDNFPSSFTLDNSISTTDKSKALVIFISYAHLISPETVLKIKNRLQSAGYTVWIDTEQISGDIDEDIIRGIASSSIVIACLSHRYYERPACKSELKRARNLGKEVIPVIVEKKYQPEGWLEFCLPDRFWIDFSDESNLDHSFKLLFKQITKFLEGNQMGKEEDPTFNQDRGFDGHHGVSAKQDSCSNWTNAQVMEWLLRNDLTSFRFMFADFDGKLLMEYKAFSQKVPDVFATHILTKFSLTNLVKLDSALAEL